MLEHTFCHIPGIGPKFERHLWSSGLHTWHAVHQADPLPAPPRRAEALRRHIPESIAHLADGNPDYFFEHLAARHHWRLFPEFRHSVAYLDIETTGLGGPDDYITAISIYDGTDIHTYVQGENLSDFRDDIARYRLLVTYNGKCFDLPFIRSYFGLPMRQAHIDLRYVLASLGYKGGLKGCERQLGLDRADLADVDGYFAVLLWWDWRHNGNRRALDTLLAYNVLDVVNLESLMVTAYNLKIAGTPFAEARRLPAPAPPELPFEPDLDTIARIRHERGWDVAEP